MLRRRIALALVLTAAFALAGCPGPSEPTDTGTPTDGGMTGDSGMMSTVTICPGDATPPLASGVCEVSGSGPGLLIQGDILAPGEVFRGGQVFVDATGTIACVGCDCTAAAGAAAATHLTCPNGVVSPGLVNAHEHITYQGIPRAPTLERYEHRSDWREPAPGHTHPPGPRAPNPAVNVPWAELRMVMGGATSLNADIPVTLQADANGFLRDLDNATTEEGLGRPPVQYDTFPLDDLSSYLQLTSGCAYSSGRETAAGIAGENAYTPHIAEGIGASARNEFLCQSSGTYDLIQPQTAMIHGVGLLPIDIQLVATSGSTLIWSPRSNISLYGDTARVTEYDRMGVPIAMGTDWIYSGSMNMLRELQCADELNASYFDGYFSDESLWRMATYNGAIALGVEDVLGSIAVGRVADIAIFDGTMHVDHRAVIDAAPADVALVMRGGVPLYGEDAVVAALPNGGTGCDTIDVCGAPRRACVMREVGMSLDALTAANSGMYALFDCAGTPQNEPSCRPERDGMGSYPSPMVNGSTIYSGMITATDGDGDGIDDATDICPTVFDPIRPMDDGMQPDADMDGVGDACDPCPLTANSTTCAAGNPNDRDNDTILDTIDNCPTTPNMDQADADSDGHGDVCDACPAAANPGAASCPATIYEIQNGTAMVGAHVATRGVVTAAGGVGFFMQVETSDAAYTVPDYSGVYVYTATAPTVAAGDAVSVDATVASYNSEIQLTMPTVTMTGLGSIPAPVAVSAADIATGGTRARALEGVLAQVTNVSVSDVAPAPGTGDTAPTFEYAVDSMLRVDDLFYRTTPFPVVGENFASITGVVALRNANSKLLPRSDADVVPGAPRIVGFSPALSYVDVGQSGVPTIPTPLTVQLARPATADTFVAVTSGDPASLTVVGGGVTVPAGTSSAPVLVDGLAQAADVTLTATLDATLMAHVRVVGAAETPTLASLTPTTATVMTGATFPFEVALDIPAPAGGTSITLSVDMGGTVPGSVTVLAGQVSGSFAFTAGATAATGTLTASGAGSPLTAALTILSGPPPHLVINEVDYDQTVNPDGMEFVEIYNSSSAPLSLAGLQLVLVNGGVTPQVAYRTIDLSTAVDVPAHGYLVVGSTALLATITADREIAFPGATDQIQNGPPDGIAIYDSASSTLVDALSYEGAIMMCTISAHTFSLVEGTVLPTATADVGAGALARTPNGTDTDDAASDWALAGTPTPGAAN